MARVVPQHRHRCLFHNADIEHDAKPSFSSYVIWPSMYRLTSANRQYDSLQLQGQQSIEHFGSLPVTSSSVPGCAGGKHLVGERGK